MWVLLLAVLLVAVPAVPGFRAFGAAASELDLHTFTAQCHLPEEDSAIMRGESKGKRGDGMSVSISQVASNVGSADCWNIATTFSVQTFARLFDTWYQ